MTAAMVSPRPFTWIEIVRLGLVQATLGAMVILSNTALNRIMVVELALPAIVPGLLIALHYSVQVLRPCWGFGADVSGRSTPWIVVGLAVLAAGSFAAACGTVLVASNRPLGLAVAALGYLSIGIGTGAAGTSLLALLATRVAPERRAAASTIVWVMLIIGFIVTAAIAGQSLQPYSHDRLLTVAATISVTAFAIALVALAGVEGPVAPGATAAAGRTSAPSFLAALSEILRDRQAQIFTAFVFISMLAYKPLDMILEPFAGLVFAFTPGQSTQLSAVLHSGVLVGMIAIGAISTLPGGRHLGSLGRWTLMGCVASALALAALVVGALVGARWPLVTNVFILGVANGVYAVAAIGSMMALAGLSETARTGTRMGVWGAAQGIASGLGGLIGAGAVDLARLITGSTGSAYSLVFAFEGALFLAAAWLALWVGRARDASAGNERRRWPIAPRQPEARPSPAAQKAG